MRQGYDTQEVADGAAFAETYGPLLGTAENARSRLRLPTDKADDDLVIQVYERLLRLRCATPARLAEDLDLPVPDVQAALDALFDLRIVRGSDEVPGQIIAMSPDMAEVEVIGPLERSIHSQHRKLATLRQQLDLLAGTFHDVRWSRRRDEVVVISRGADETRLRLAEAAQHCQREVLTMQPGGARDPEQLHDALPRDLAMLERNIRMRIIYQHTARTDTATRNYVRQVMQKGAEARTSNEIFDRMIIFDRGVAFVPQQADGRCREQGAAIVYEPAIVGLLCSIYDHFWSSATEFDTNETAYGETLDDVRMAILELLVAGFKDDVISRRLGMSSRTCRRHISTLMCELNATSRFQAGFVAARAGLLPAPEDAADT